MSGTMQSIWIMGAVGLVVGFCAGALFAYWDSDRRQKLERKSRQEIAAMVKSARDQNKQRRVAP